MVRIDKSWRLKQAAQDTSNCATNKNREYLRSRRRKLQPEAIVMRGRKEGPETVGCSDDTVWRVH